MTDIPTNQEDPAITAELRALVLEQRNKQTPLEAIATRLAAIQVEVLTPAQRLEYLAVQASIEFRQGEYDAAKTTMQEGLALAKELEHEIRQARFKASLALINKIQSPEDFGAYYHLASEAYEQAVTIELGEDANEVDQAELNVTLAQAGGVVVAVRVNFGQPAAALPIVERIAPLIDTEIAEGELLNLLDAIANMYLELNDLDNAALYLDKFEENTQADTSPDIVITYYTRRGELLARQGCDQATLEEWYAKAEELLDDERVDDSTKIIIVGDFGVNFARIGETQRGRELMIEALSRANKMDSLDDLIYYHEKLAETFPAEDAEGEPEE